MAHAGNLFLLSPTSIALPSVQSCLLLSAAPVWGCSAPYDVSIAGSFIPLCVFTFSLATTAVVYIPQILSPKTRISNLFALQNRATKKRFHPSYHLVSARGTRVSKHNYTPTNPCGCHTKQILVGALCGARPIPRTLKLEHLALRPTLILPTGRAKESASDHSGAVVVEVASHTNTKQ